MVSTQFGSILDAIKMKKKEFVFEGEEISLVPTCGCFITMNPGYPHICLAYQHTKRI